MFTIPPAVLLFNNTPYSEDPTMKLTLMLGALTVLLLCVVEETSGHAANPSQNDVIHREMTEAERKERRRQRMENKKKRKQSGLEK